MTERAIRVLHSFASLNRGGIETWLMNILRQRSEELHFDFLLDRPGGVYEEEARSYGCKIFYTSQTGKLQKRLSMVGLGRYPLGLEQVLKENPYDVFHCHTNEFGGDIMKAAFKAGIPVRVVHSHNTALARGNKSIEMSIRSLRFRTINRYRIRKYATDIVACSSDAGRFLVGEYWDIDPRCRTIFCGISLDRFNEPINKWKRNKFRKNHGIPLDKIVVGHAGSMGPSLQKNHNFLIEIFQELVKKDDRYFLYMAGDGPLRSTIEHAVNKRGLSDHICMPGIVDNIPSLMIHGFDVHLLPSLFEGLPVVGLEAVASGCFTVCSDTITKDFTEFFSERVTTVSLRKSPSVWADKVEEAVRKRIPAQEGIALVKKSPFSITSSLEAMANMYKTRLKSK